MSSGRITIDISLKKLGKASTLLSPNDGHQQTRATTGRPSISTVASSSVSVRGSCQQVFETRKRRSNAMLKISETKPDIIVVNYVGMFQHRGMLQERALKETTTDLSQPIIRPTHSCQRMLLENPSGS